MNFGAVILAGGKSRRMGRNKAQLTVNGQSFLDIITAELSGFAELMVSVDDAALHPEILLPMVSDAYSDCGPMSGYDDAGVNAEFFADQPNVTANFICSIGYGDKSSIFDRSPRPEFTKFNSVL